MHNDLSCYLTPAQLFGWAKANFGIIKLNEDLDEDQIARLMRWIGGCTFDTIFIDGDRAQLGRAGISNMLLVMLIEFPKRYEEWGLSQDD